MLMVKLFFVQMLEFFVKGNGKTQSKIKTNFKFEILILSTTTFREYKND